MHHTQALRDFWNVPTLDQAKHERVTVPPQPDAWTDEYQSQLLDRVLGDLALTPGSVILDYGCGVGRVARQVARRGCRVIAVDVAEQMLAHCRDFCADVNGIDYVLSDGYGIAAVPEASVDGAYSLFVFQHMPGLGMARSVLADLQRVLKTGAWCKIQTVDTHTETAVAQVGFHGERQTAAFMMEIARAADFSRIKLSLEAEGWYDNIWLTLMK